MPHLVKAKAARAWPQDGNPVPCNKLSGHMPVVEIKTIFILIALNNISA